MYVFHVWPHAYKSALTAWEASLAGMSAAIVSAPRVYRHTITGHFQHLNEVWIDCIHKTVINHWLLQMMCKETLKSPQNVIALAVCEGALKGPFWDSIESYGLSCGKPDS